MKRNRLEVAVRGLLLAAAVIITLVIVALGFNQLTQSKEAASVVSQALHDTTESLRDADVKQYSETDMTGAEVKNFYKKYLGTSSTTHGDFSIVIANTGGTATYTDGSGFTTLENTSSSGYVKPTAMYHCTVNVNANGVITSVKFTIK